jgi:hypothetical protein
MEFFLKATALFVKYNIGSWILNWVMHCSFSLDSKNALLSKCGIGIDAFFAFFFVGF